MYNRNGNDLTKNKPVHVIMVLIEYVDIADSIVNAHLCSLTRAFIVLRTNIEKECNPEIRFLCSAHRLMCISLVFENMQSRITVHALCTSTHPPLNLCKV